MIRTAAEQGVSDAVMRFRIREASALEAILGALGAGVGGSLARGAIGAISPRILPALENAGAAPVNLIRRAVTPSPASVLAKHIANAQLPPPPPVRIV